MVKYFFKIVKIYELVIIIGSILLVFYCLINPTNPIDNLVASLLAQTVIYSIFTAIITTVAVRCYFRFDKYISNRKFIGYWMPLIFRDDDYALLPEYIEISFSKHDFGVLNYYSTNYEILNQERGLIYIDERNRFKGTLIQSYDWIGNIGGLYPVFSESLYLDNESKWLTKNAIIRLMSSEGIEKRILCRPIDQEKYEKYFKEKYNKTIEKSASQLSDEAEKVFEKMARG